MTLKDRATLETLSQIVGAIHLGTNQLCNIRWVEDNGRRSWGWSHARSRGKYFLMWKIDLCVSYKLWYHENNKYIWRKEFFFFFTWLYIGTYMAIYTPNERYTQQRWTFIWGAEPEFFGEGGPTSTLMEKSKPFPKNPFHHGCMPSFSV